MDKIKVDIIIPTYHPGDEFGCLLRRLQGQTFKPGKIIVMNTQEDGWKKTWEEEFPMLEVHHLAKEEFDHGGTRRQAAKLSDSDIMVFMTQDALPADKKMLENLVRPIVENSRVGAAYARQLPAKKCRYLERYTRMFNYPLQSSVKGTEDIDTYGVKTFFCSNVCAAYDKEIYEKTGGFVERAIFNEDMIYAGTMVQAGYQIAYVADAKVVHSHNYSSVQQLHRNFDLGVSQAEHPEIFAAVPSEGEGIQLVKKSLSYLCRTGHFWLIPQLVVQSGFKYTGYTLGKNYRRLPLSAVKKLTMNQAYWNHKETD